MRHPAHAVLFASLLAALGPVSAEEAAVTTAPTIRQAERVEDVEKYLKTLREAVTLAKSGEYGSIKRGDRRRLDNIHDRIEDMLDGRKSTRELDANQMAELLRLETSLNDIMRSNDKSRMVCKRTQTLGSRIGATECMTVGEREQRAKAARETTNRILNDVGCIPTPTQDCGG